MIILAISTLALVILEPFLQSSITKIVTFSGYIVGAAIFSLVAIDYGREVDMEGLFIAACVALVGAAIVYLIVNLAAGNGRHEAPPVSHEHEHGSEIQHPNFVPPVKPKYRSTTRRVLRATKVYNPREHWAVKEQK